MSDENLYLQAERQHEERRGWHEEALATFDKDGDTRTRVVKRLVTYMAIRAFIELMILIILIILAF